MAERSRVWVWIRRLVGLAILGVVLAVGGLAGLYWWAVVRAPAPHLDREHILRLISQESPVYYGDGVTKLGVFFSEEHRQYVPAAQLPRHYVDGLVSAEDRGFFDHAGFSIKGMSRATVQNLRAGRTVAGGSTLTQQTAKNLFERRGRTYKEKLRELANALRLERRYTKLEILEFYSNQFYVNGNGRGLAIASRFFFDKTVDQLDLLECAFLAGVVKSPNRYNPFVPDPARQKRAREAGRERATYVLARMLEDGKIDAAVFATERDRPIPYKRGKFRFERSVVLDAVEQELDSPEFRRTLLAHDIADPGRAGLRIVTTLSSEAQRGALYALRHHLSDVGLWLEAPTTAALFGEPAPLHPVEEETLVPHTFHTGLLLSVDPEKGTALVDLGGVHGVLDVAAWTRLATALKRGRDKNTWATASRQDRRALLDEAKGAVGRTVPVSVRGAAADGTLELDIEPEVALEGAVIALEHGEVRAMVGGWENIDFNRAVVARRQLGSTWKLVLFEAALQLGWSVTDPLDNRRGVFPYQGTFYYPRPDHKGAPEQVSIGWAAAKSENLATIWLLDHLSDPLTSQQFAALADRVGLTQRSGEERAAFVRRIQGEGVLPTQDKLLEGLFQNAWRNDITPDLLFEGREADAAIGESLAWGLGFDEERATVLKGDPDVSREEQAIRLGVLDRSFLRQERVAGDAAEARARLLDHLDRGGDPTADLLAGFALGPADRAPRSISFGQRHPDGWEPLTVGALAALLAAAPEDEAEPPPEPDLDPERDPPADPDDVDRLFAPEPSGGPPPRPAARAAPVADGLRALLAPERLRLEALLTEELVSRARQAVDAARAQLGDVEMYSMDVLSRVEDYRMLVHLRYLVHLARRSGVRSTLSEVPSLPLGSSDITLLEAALLYQGMITGETYRFYPDMLSVAPGTAVPADEVDPPAGVPRRDDISLIAEVRLSDDTVIYRTAREARRLHEVGVAAELATMLRAVVTHGTGRRAADGVRPGSRSQERAALLAKRGVVLPLFGKTGTTNSYKNSAFVGWVPGFAGRGAPPDGDEPLPWGEGVVVATYVGYDDNREMKNGSVRLAGASGSLPAWLGAVESVALSADTGDRVDLVDLDFGGGGELDVSWPREVRRVPVDAATGLAIDADSSDSPVAWLHVRVDGPAFAPAEP